MDRGKIMYMYHKNKIIKGYQKNKVARSLGVSRSTLDKLILENRIKTTKKGKSELITESDYITLKEIVITGNYNSEAAITTIESVDSSVNDDMQSQPDVNITSVNVKSDATPIKIIEIELLKKENEKLEQDIEYFKSQLEITRTDYKEELKVKNVLLKEREDTFNNTISNFQKIIATKEAIMETLSKKLIFLEENFTGKNEELEKIKQEKDNKIKVLLEQIKAKDIELSDVKLSRGQVIEIESEKEILQGRVNALVEEKQALVSSLESEMVEKDIKINTLTESIASLEQVKVEKEKLEKELKELKNKGFFNKFKKIFGLK